MDNILYIGPYREFSGMGNAARNYIKSLILAGYNISLRPIYNTFRNYPEYELDSQIMELEDNFSKKYHKVIQHCYPHQLSYSNKFDQNIGIIHLESKNYRGCLSHHINNMDTIIVGSEFVKTSLVENNDVKCNVRVVPEPIDIESINYYKTNTISKKIENNYSFYVISDFIKRKNLDTILLAFLILSDQYDNIDLVIKTKSSGLSDIDEPTIQYEFEKIYSTLRKNIFKKPKILVGHIKYDGIRYIHYNNDCLINLSSGESFGYSVLEAMCFDNNTIVPSNTALSALVQNTGFVVDSSDEQCLDSDRVFHIYNTIDQKWSRPSLNSLVAQMTKSINESKRDKELRINKQKNIVNNMSIEKIAETLSNI